MSDNIIAPENLVYKKPKLLNNETMHYCPGCSHGVVHKLVSEVIEEMGMEDKAIGVSPVGCAVFAYRYIDNIIAPENLVYKKPKLLNNETMHYCPGCSHGVVHKLVSEVIEEMGMEDKAIGVSPVGCAVFAYRYIDIDWQEAPHGRAPALATGIKRVWPDRLVFTYQGDGDLACIGTAETIHALNRGENISIIFINNAIYGMTGGQMAPTTLIGQKTATCPYGRDPKIHGYPLNITQIASGLEGTCFVSRQSVETMSAIIKAKKAIRKAFTSSMLGKGSSLVEIVSTCNSGWKLSPIKANEWMRDNMYPKYVKGDLKDTTGL